MKIVPVQVVAIILGMAGIVMIFQEDIFDSEATHLKPLKSVKMSCDSVFNISKEELKYFDQCISN